MFFEDEYGDFYPISQILRIESRSSAAKSATATKRARHLVSLAEGRAVRVMDFEVEKILQAGRIVTANPGFCVIHRDEEDPSAVFKAPIVAWAISGNGDASPITPDGLNDGLDSPISILAPDGQVIEPQNCAHESVEAFLQSKRENP